MLSFLKKWLFGHDEREKKTNNKNRTTRKNSTVDNQENKAKKIGDIGEYKINIQLDQLPKDCLYLDDLMIINPKAKSGYSQIDHVVISPDGIFVIETKNYKGNIYGNKKDQYWSVNKRFRLKNPLHQNYGHIKALESILSDFGNLRYRNVN